MSSTEEEGVFKSRILEEEENENILKLDDRTDSSDNILLTFSTSLSKEVETCKEEDSLRGAMNEARKTGMLCDITLLIGPDKESIRGHRLVLSLVSEYFKTMLNSGFKERDNKEVELPHMDMITVESILNFAYTETIELTNGNIEKITRGAHYFRIPKLLAICTKYIKDRLNYRNCVEVLQFAEYIDNTELKNSAISYFYKHFDTISSRNLDLMKMSTSLLLAVLEHENASVDGHPGRNEERLFQIGWNHLFAKSDSEWEMFLPKLLKAVHLPLTSEQFLCDLMKRVEDHKEAKALVEKAKLLKSTLADENIVPNGSAMEEKKIWCADRSLKSGSVSVVCENIDKLKDSWFRFCSNSIVLNGIRWKFQVFYSIKNTGNFCTKMLDCDLKCLLIGSKSVQCNYQFEIIPPSQKVKQKSYLSKPYSHTFTQLKGQAPEVGGIMTLDRVLKDYCDDGSVKVVCHIEVQ